ncbi:hypothetical protein SAMN06295905_1353 [Devosia lucknowensis]|uniref:Uncharacterized protein n=1 Tax=Devosia lucknowensis TaxID=1096929 RepID=A0A1Y6ET91_9HYPH|nr:hypothetical protein [Devosia lucknowensis]SMQ65934.1 hypothetical protein SAMN06295905_1353 [Devosia lucknowensis]
MASDFVAQRLALNARIDAAALRPANDNLSVQPTTKDEAIARVIARRAEMDGMVKPTPAYQAMAKKLTKRQSKGDPAAANDNDTWPLRDQLNRDRSTALLRVAERYRAISDSAEAQFEMMGSGPSLEAQSLLQSKTFNMATGKDKRHGIKRIAGAPVVSDGTFQSSKAAEPDDEANLFDGPKPGATTFKIKAAKRAPKKWNGDDPLIAHIDSQRAIARLRACLGSLVDVFEDAVLHGETLSAIGRAKGGNSASSGPIGRAFVMDGLQLVQDELRLMDLEQQT